MFETEKTEERVILMGVCAGAEEETAESLDELAELVKTAGAMCVDSSGYLYGPGEVRRD